MHNLTPGTAFALGILAGWVIVALLYASFWLARPWMLAWGSGSPVGIPHLIGMRLRGTPTMLLVSAYVALRKRGQDVDLNALEAGYLAYSSELRTIDDLVRWAQKNLVKEGK